MRGKYNPYKTANIELAWQQARNLENASFLLQGVQWNSHTFRSAVWTDYCHYIWEGTEMTKLEGTRQGKGYLPLKNNFKKRKREHKSSVCIIESWRNFLFLLCFYPPKISFLMFFIRVIIFCSFTLLLEQSSCHLMQRLKVSKSLLN